MNYRIGIDIGGTNIKYAVFDSRAEMVLHDSAATPSGGARTRVTEAVASIVDKLAEQFGGIDAVGISSAGVVDPSSGVIAYAGPTMPGYRGTNLKLAVEETFGVRARVVNDVNAAACGEQWKGAARGSRHFFCLTIGTGIGGALVCDGETVLGHRFRAGEIGHSLYDKTTRTTYEQRASMSALWRKVAQAAPDFSGGGQELFAAAKSGHPIIVRVIDEWVEEISRGIANVILVVDPEIVVIGGGVSEQKAYLLDKIKFRLAEYLPPGFSDAELVMASLGNKAALFGAVYPYYNNQQDGVRQS